tara:strand:- start:45067 stop:45660 length:594 start_codon:yes stop_codon:yes gene_type:complete
MDRNEEKLKILQERLRQIKEKDENISSRINTINSRNENVTDNISENSNKKTSKSKSYILISFVFVFALAFIISKNYDNLKFYFDANFDKNDAIVNDEINVEKEIEIPITKEYYLDKLISDEKGEIAVILNTNSEDDAIKMKNELISKGFKANYFFSSDYSNISEESYEILIGPYESENELKQWLNNISTKSITRISL